jgi:hypothetical protein
LDTISPAAILRFRPWVEQVKDTIYYENTGGAKIIERVQKYGKIPYSMVETNAFLSRNKNSESNPLSCVHLSSNHLLQRLNLPIDLFTSDGKSNPKP